MSKNVVNVFHMVCLNDAVIYVSGHVKLRTRDWETHRKIKFGFNVL